MTAGKGSTAHFVWRCGLCKREHSAKFEPGEKPKSYSADANGQFAPFLTMDCRGLEFVGFDPKVWPSKTTSFICPDKLRQGIWKCVGADSGTVFTDVDLEEGEWVDYDEKVSFPPRQYFLLSTRHFRQPFLSVSPTSRANGPGLDCT